MPEPMTLRPGDRILDRAMPHASPEEREAARANLDRLAALIARILMRQADQTGHSPIRSNQTPEVE